MLHVADLVSLIIHQIDNLEDLSGETFNVGGGADISVSLCELTALCREIAGNEIEIGSEVQDRPADIPTYISDCSRIEQATGWKPKRDIERILHDIHAWIVEHEKALLPILS